MSRQRHPRQKKFTCVSSGGTVDSVSGSCSTERGGLFHFLVVLSLTMSYCVTDGDEPAKAPEAKKNSAETVALILIFIFDIFNHIRYLFIKLIFL